MTEDETPLSRLARRREQIEERARNDPEFAAWRSEIRKNIDARVGREMAEDEARTCDPACYCHAPVDI